MHPLQSITLALFASAGGPVVERLSSLPHILRWLTPCREPHLDDPCVALEGFSCLTLESLPGSEPSQLSTISGRFLFLKMRQDRRKRAAPRQRLPAAEFDRDRTGLEVEAH